MATSGFAARTQRRKNLELSMLRRPSETASIPSQYSATTAGPPSISDRQDPSPSSPHSSVSTSASSVVIENYDKFQALQLQLQKNTAQIELNEARMKQIEIDDTRMGEDIQARLTAVMELNQRLSLLRAMLARAEKVSQGDFGVKEQMATGMA
ncbi:hypothetical protein HII31_09824 [Pseudocercospora fuligena]|uniref:Uncharacterized protein n=1 Tax=Pseudocercospora fuligena TaxID=685502 RepID=A0A8H6RF64_9PEZI|nr:hypothetical protein HII31_09824 [Pseudocercospora fuligena]